MFIELRYRKALVRDRGSLTVYELCVSNYSPNQRRIFTRNFFLSFFLRTELLVCYVDYSVDSVLLGLDALCYSNRATLSFQVHITLVCPPLW